VTAPLPVYRAVVVGCGHIGSAASAEALVPGVHSHAQAYVEHERTRLVGVCDADAGRAAAAEARWKAEAATDAVALCRRERPEIVSVCTPDATHFRVARDILDAAAPRLLLMEKPVALTVAEGEALEALAARKSCLVAVNYSRRFLPPFRAIADELRRGRHGRPLLARVVYGKGLLHNGSHALDLLRWWLGEPEGARKGPPAWGPPGDPSDAADLWFAGGARARLDPVDARVATVFEMDLLTERSRIAFTEGGREWTFHEVADSPVHPGYRAYARTGREGADPLFTAPDARVLWHVVDNVVAALDGSSPLLCTGADGVEAVRWVERIRA
jgi:predicted dehydrogenase